MSRMGLLIVLAVAAVIGAVFAAFPELDLAISAPFFDPANRRWAAAGWDLHLRNLATAVIAMIAAPAVIAPLLKLVLPRRAMLIPGRAAVLMISTLLLAPGLIANVILKDNWGRPRPFFITQFGGVEQFLPWWDPRGSCRGNCSFVAGEPSGAFWTLAPAAVAPPAWRAAAYAAALGFGAAVGLLRIAAGGHFFTDVVFAGVFTFLVIWLMHGLLYRWQIPRLAAAGDAARRPE